MPPWCNFVAKLSCSEFLWTKSQGTCTCNNNVILGCTNVRTILFHLFTLCSFAFFTSASNEALAFFYNGNNLSSFFVCVTSFFFLRLFSPDLVYFFAFSSRLRKNLVKYFKNYLVTFQKINFANREKRRENGRQIRFWAKRL